MKLGKGDRLEIIGLMTEEPNPIPVGTRGTVVEQTNTGTVFEQVWVDWDDGSRLMLIPEDYWIVRRVE